MKLLRRALRALVYAIVPYRLVRILRSPALVPGEYRESIRDVESVLALIRRDNGLDDEYWAQVLRKHAHIIDKGLRRGDREPGHSCEVHQSAREALSHIRSQAMLEDPSIVWAAEKISEYERFQSDGVYAPGGPACVETRCSYEALLDAVKTRRSLRSYSDRSVSLDVIRKIVEVVNWSPGSCNRQTAKVFVSRDPSSVRAALATCKGATGFSEFVPCFLAFCADLRGYDMPKEMFLPTLDVALGVQNCCLIAHTLGLSLTPLSWARHTEEERRELRELLGIPSYYQIVINGALGYPECGALVPLRKAIESTWVVR